jgi:hypothetical protein
MVQDVRADLGKPVDPWFVKLRPEIRAIALPLHKVVLSAVPGMKAELKWGSPCYLKDGMVCGMMAAKAHLGLFFYKGTKLKDPRKLLQGSGNTLRSLKFTAPKEIPAAAVKGFVKAAAALNRAD